jgi:glycine cleavage system H lipoate-binding protein
VNKALAEKPETVNSDPHGAWMIALKVSALADDLLDADEYARLTQ